MGASVWEREANIAGASVEGRGDKIEEKTCASVEGRGEVIAGASV